MWIWVQILCKSRQDLTILTVGVQEEDWGLILYQSALILNPELILVKEKVLYLCKEDKGWQNPCLETIIVIVMLLSLKLFYCTVLYLQKYIVFGYFGCRSNDTKLGVFCWLKHTKWTLSSIIIVWWLLIIWLNLQIGFKKDLPTRFWKFLHVWNQLRFLFLIVSLLLDKLLWFKISPLNQYVILGVGTMIQN